MRGRKKSLLTAARHGLAGPSEKAKLTCPRHFNSEEKKAWKKFASLLRESNSLAETDSTILESLVSVFTFWQDAQRKVAQQGFSASTIEGGVKTSPDMIAFLGLQDRLLRLLAELGLTPNARLRLLGSLAAKNDMLEQFLNKKREREKSRAAERAALLQPESQEVH